MKNKLFASLVTLGLISILAGCSKMPKTEIDAAKTAVAQAKASGIYRQILLQFRIP